MKVLLWASLDASRGRLMETDKLLDQLTAALAEEGLAADPGMQTLMTRLKSRVAILREREADLTRNVFKTELELFGSPPLFQERIENRRVEVFLEGPRLPGEEFYEVGILVTGANAGKTVRFTLSGEKGAKTFTGTLHSQTHTAARIPVGTYLDVRKQLGKMLTITAEVLP